MVSQSIRKSDALKSPVVKPGGCWEHRELPEKFPMPAIGIYFLAAVEVADGAGFFCSSVSTT